MNAVDVTDAGRTGVCALYLLEIYGLLKPHAEMGLGLSANSLASLVDGIESVLRINEHEARA